MLKTPFYNPHKSYDENYELGPFGDFTDGKITKIKSPAKFEAYGHKVHSPFGIPAGPLLNSNFVKSAFEKGFDICVYKTVRGQSYASHKHPNVIAVHTKGDLTIEKAKLPVVADENFEKPLSITNSFGVPSKDPVI
ncbi:MAG: hypothetical protein COT91_04440 [Candidatus Doudnabacteria bacterium CG10_big_fil_rev_8_21_14_0_10_41_10]|uniref:Uncharacterized protein n=1 Tax=Candidatus Doudnabacteria bacterium CG10_big_fil_rev_8_21_14_0_10_41_10 TaxID=1974551 RepID=A0A2H0VCM6_9BACT|nr:MAG: hypothetical protein COT91_04440 [Candidatus Doudnabacteria bacterium CG10_big_fil_rev_8_21_14_0_10_41_10]